MADSLFWAKVKFSDTCWLWEGAKIPSGYGHVNRNGKTWKAHRWAWLQTGHPLDDTKELDHLCRVRHCVNPEHLEQVNHLENMQRGIPLNAKKTHCKLGHPYSGLNLKIYGDRRYCRACLERRGILKPTRLF